MTKKTDTIDERIRERIEVLNDTEIRLSGNIQQFIKGFICRSKGVSRKSSCISLRVGDKKYSSDMLIVGEDSIRTVMETCSEILALSSYIDDPPKPREKIRETAKVESKKRRICRVPLIKHVIIHSTEILYWTNDRKEASQEQLDKIESAVICHRWGGEENDGEKLIFLWMTKRKHDSMQYLMRGFECGSDHK